jgi:hypothetical protein
MARPQESKQLAGRIDPQYIRRPDSRIIILRIAGIIVGLAAILWWLGFGRSINSGAIYNPGPVIPAHAMWQNQCSVCHDGAAASPGQGSQPADAHKGFFRRASDSACLKCHDAAIHDRNQRRFVSLVDNQHPLSTNCTHCHVEHHGRDVFLGNDMHCLQCHADLSKEMKAGAHPQVQISVTTFKIGAHPDFGRSLQRGPGDPTLVDPTVLKFNHKVHMKLDAINSNCTLCHSTGESSPGNQSQPPPALAAVGARDRRYMRPITYDRDCKSCHALAISDAAPGPALAHRQLELVRSQLADVRGVYERWRATVKPTDAAAPAAASQWLDDLKGEIETAINEAPDGTPGIAPLRDALDAAANSPSTPPNTQPDAGNNTAAAPAQSEVYPTVADTSRLEYRVAFLAKNSCVKCHELQGEVPLVLAHDLAVRATALTQPAETPETQAAANTGAQTVPVLLSTLPTGIFPSSSRRWFTHAEFDHDAHRSQSCIECHSQALNSVKTSDVLLPTIQSCVACHHPPSGNDLGAGAACVTCHKYHDRSLELPALIISATQPVVAAN